MELVFIFLTNLNNFINGFTEVFIRYESIFNFDLVLWDSMSLRKPK
jgi:hypothetical protein